MTERDYYIVFEGLEHGVNDEPNAFAAPAEFMDNVNTAYENSINGGFANEDAGLFLYKLTGVTEEQAEQLEEDADKVVRDDFDGFTFEVVKSWKSDESAWSDESKGDIEEDGEADADGFYRPAGYNDDES